VGMANSVQASRVEEATNLYAISDTCTIAIRESLLCDELDGLASEKESFKQKINLRVAKLLWV
jgi:hypothetical protein